MYKNFNRKNIVKLLFLNLLLGSLSMVGSELVPSSKTNGNKGKTESSFSKTKALLATGTVMESKLLSRGGVVAW